MKPLLLCLLAISCFLPGCEQGEPTPVFCLLKTSTGEITCRETKAGGKIYDAKITDLKDEDGWICTSSEDFSEMKKYYIEQKQKLKQCEAK